MPKLKSGAGRLPLPEGRTKAGHCRDCARANSHTHAHAWAQSDGRGMVRNSGAGGSGFVRRRSGQCGRNWGWSICYLCRRVVREDMVSELSPANRFSHGAQLLPAVLPNVGRTIIGDNLASAGGFNYNSYLPGLVRPSSPSSRQHVHTRSHQSLYTSRQDHSKLIKSSQCKRFNQHPLPAAPSLPFCAHSCFSNYSSPAANL